MRRAVSCTLAIWLACCLPSVAQNRTSPTDNSAQAIGGAETLRSSNRPASFRPILIPDSRKAEFIRGMVPIRKAEFLDKWRQLQQLGRPTQIKARIKSAVYRATLENETWVQGQAELQIEPLEQDRAVMLALGHVSMAISEPRWKGDQDRPPQWGVDGIGQTWLEVNRQDEFQFAWSFRGQRNAVGEIEFQFQLPPTLHNLIELTTPAGVIVRSEAGIVHRQQIDTSAGDSPVVWRIETGGRQSFSVFCVESNRPSQRKLGVYQKTDYLLSRSGLEANIELHASVRGGPLSSLEVVVDPALVLISAQIGDEFLRDEAIQIDQDSEGARWRILLPKPLQGQAEPLRLRAFSRAELESLWAVPQVRVGDNEWTATDISLELAQDLELRRFVLDRAHHRGVSRSAQGNLRLQFEHMEAAGKIELVVGERSNQLVVESGLNLQLAPERITAKLVADVSADQGDLYTVTVTPAADWRILSITTIPATALLAEEFEWTSEAPFEIPLRTPATKNKPVRIVIDGVREYPASARRVRFGEARMVEFATPMSERRLVRVLGAENGQAVLSEDVGVLRLAPDELDEIELERLGGSSGVLFRDASRVHGSVASLRPQASSFAVAVDARIDVEAQRMSEIYRLRCTPDSMTLGEIIVRFSQHRDNDVSWSLVDHPSGIVSALKLTPRAGETAEQWRITFRQAFDQPFELIARRDSAIGSGDVNASLIDVVGASTQLSQIVVQSSDKTPLKLQPEGLNPATPPAAPKGQYSLVQAAYHHETPRRAALRIARLEDVKPACWVWRMSTHARLEATGLVGYRAVFQIENAGRSEITLSVPKNTIDWLVYVDDLEAAAYKSGDRITVPLPNLRSRPTVVLRYRTRGKPVRWSGNVSLSPPEPDMQVLRRDWTVLLPPGFVSWPDASQAQDWRRRLLNGSLTSLLNALQNESGHWRTLWLDDQQIFLQSMSQALAEQRPTTLAGFAEAWSTSLGKSGRRLLVDDDSLQAASIQPNQTIDVPSDRMSGERARQWLRRHGLVLQSSRANMVLRSQRSIENAVDLGSRLSDLQNWGRTERTPATNWEVEIANPDPVSRPNRVRLQFPETATVQASFYNETAYAAWEWCVVCIALALTLRLGKQATPHAISAGMLLIALTLWAPENFVFVLRGAAYGVLIGSIVSHLIRGRISPTEWVEEPDSNSSDSGATRSVTGSAVVTGVVSWILILAYTCQVTAQNPVKERGQFGLPNDRPNVLIPANEKLEPVGDFYYVTPSLYRQLLGAASQEGKLTLKWLIRDATYTIRAERDAMGEVNARMTIDVRRTGVVTTPFPIDRISSAFWDGRPISIDPQSKVLEVFARSTGEHELEVVLKPLLVENAEPFYSIPSAPTSDAIVVLELAAQLSDVRFLNARGEVRQLAPDRWIVQLGHREDIHVRWLGLGQPADVREIEAEELYWLRVRPNSVSVDAQLHLRPLRNNLRQFTMLADPRLQLLNIGREQGVEKHETVTASNEWVMHRFVLSDPIENDRTLRLSFLWKGMGGLGRISAPRLKVDARYVRDRRLAISVAKPLIWDLKRDDQWESLAPAEFASAWGDEGAPLTAFRAPREDAAWTLHTRYPRPNSSAQGEMIVVVEDKKVLSEMTINFQDASTDRFQHRLKTPPGWQLISASLIDSGRERSIQARLETAETGGEGQLTLFSERPLTSAHRLKLVGSMARPKSAFQLPLLELLDGNMAIESVKVYRWPDATPLRWVKVKGFDRESPLAGEEYSAAYGRLEAVLKRNQDPLDVLLRTSSKKVSAATGVIVTSLTREKGQWRAASQFRLNVRNNSPLDVLRFEVPIEWKDLTLQPAWSHRLAHLPDSARQQLIVYPPKPVLQATLAIQGTLEVEGEDRMREAPEITPLDLRSLKRYLILPMRLQNQRYVWEVSGREEEPPADLKPTLPVSGEYQSILALGNSQASVQVVRQSVGSLSIKSADYRLRWRGPREAYGVAQFDVDPAGAQRCLLSTPHGVQLLGVYVDGIERHRSSRRERSWSIALGPEQLPQRITVVFVLQKANDGTQAAPFLADENNDPLPCLNTWWTVDSAINNHSWINARTVVAGRAVDHDLARLKSAVAIMNLAAKRDTGAGQSELLAWFLTWSARLSTLEAKLNEALPRANDATAREIREAVAASAVVQNQTANRLSAPQNASLPFLSDPAAAWELTSGQGVQQYVEFTDVQQPGVPLSPNSKRRPLQAPHWLLICGLALTAGVVVASRNFAGLREWFVSWPQTVLAAAGLIWWACMPAPWLGLVVAGLMLFSSFDSGWRTTRR